MVALCSCSSWRLTVLPLYPSHPGEPQPRCLPLEGYPGRRGRNCIHQALLPSELHLQLQPLSPPQTLLHLLLGFSQIHHRQSKGFKVPDHPGAFPSPIRFPKPNALHTTQTLCPFHCIATNPANIMMVFIIISVLWVSALELQHGRRVINHSMSPGTCSVLAQLRGPFTFDL